MIMQQLELRYSRIVMQKAPYVRAIGQGKRSTENRDRAGGSLVAGVPASALVGAALASRANIVNFAASETSTGLKLSFDEGMAERGVHETRAKLGNHYDEEPP